MGILRDIRLIIIIEKGVVGNRPINWNGGDDEEKGYEPDSKQSGGEKIWYQISGHGKVMSFYSRS